MRPKDEQQILYENIESISEILKSEFHTINTTFKFIIHKYLFVGCEADKTCIK